MSTDNDSLMSTTQGLSKFKAHCILLRNRLLIKICAGEYGNPATGVFRYSSNDKYGSLPS